MLALALFIAVLSLTQGGVANSRPRRSEMGMVDVADEGRKEVFGHEHDSLREAPRRDDRRDA